MAVRDTTQSYSEDEAQKRFEAALRGSRKVGHMPMESLTPKPPKGQQKRKPAKASPSSDASDASE
jgi:hypothetical protein